MKRPAERYEPSPATGRARELLDRLSSGDGQANEELLHLLYAELRDVAAHCMAGQRPDHTLQPTALVHEAWMRIVANRGEAGFQDQTHFLRSAARAMRHVLVDHARIRGAQKRDRGARAETLAGVDSSGSNRGLASMLSGFAERQIDVLSLDEALERLAEQDPDLVRIVELRFFAGLTVAEVAAALGISERTVHRGWGFARVWLQEELTDFQ